MALPVLRDSGWWSNSDQRRGVLGLPSPVAFLCHASEDKETVRALAHGLMANGVDVFFDEWEIGPGDSIRQRIDHGLGGCSHFIAVLTSTSLRKPWVNLELDAGLVRRVEGQAKFIPLRMGLPVSELPPLLRGMHSPSIGDPETDAASLASFMHGVSLKPPLGPSPTAVRQASRNVGLSPAAQAIARLMAEASKQGRHMDPQLSPEDIMQGCAIGSDDMIDGADELEATGMVKKLHALGHEYFAILYPATGFFPTFDPVFKIGSPENDARLIAADLVNNGGRGAATGELAKTYGWTPRRMNPAVEFLTLNNLAMAPGAIDPEWSSPYIMTTPATRRFAREAN